MVDTVLAKLHAQKEETAQLYDLISTSPYLVLDELEPVFKKTGQYNALCTLYLNRGEDQKVLEVWSKYVFFSLPMSYGDLTEFRLARLVDGEWTDQDIPDPLTKMFDLLTQRKDRQLVQRWVLWLTNKDTERAIKASQSYPDISIFR